MVGQGVVSLTGLAINALLARLLSPKDMGAYFLVLSLASTVALFGRMGLGRTVVRMTAAARGAGDLARARVVVSTVLRLAMIGALLVGFLYLLFGNQLATRIFRSELIGDVTLLVALLIVIQSLQTPLAEAFRGFQDVRLATFFGGLLVKLVSSSVLAILLVLEKRLSLSDALIISLMAWYISAGLGSFFLHRRLAGIVGDASVDLREVFRMAGPFFVTSLAFTVLGQVDIWVLGRFQLQEDVAVYGAALRLVTLVVTPLTIVNAVVPPIIAQMSVQDRKQELEDTLRNTATIAGLPALVILAILVFFGESILGVVYGDYYRTGGVVLSLLALGQLANGWAGSCGLTLMMSGHQVTMMIITVISGIITAGSAILLVKEHGMIGVAIGASCGLIIQNLMMWLAARIKTGVWTHIRVPGFGLFSD